MTGSIANRFQVACFMLVCFAAPSCDGAGVAHSPAPSHAASPISPVANSPSPAVPPSDQQSTRVIADSSAAPPSHWPAGCVDGDDDLWPTCPGIHTDFSQDCDDGNELAFPGAGPGCDGTDRNCNGIVDTHEPGGCVNADPPPNGRHIVAEGVEPPPRPWPADCVDEDRDHFPSCAGAVDIAVDCDDSDPNRFPGAGPACDGSDRNCDGVPDTEATNGCQPSDPSATARP